MTVLTKNRLQECLQQFPSLADAFNVVAIDNLSQAVLAGAIITPESLMELRVEILNTFGITESASGKLVFKTFGSNQARHDFWNSIAQKHDMLDFSKKHDVREGSCTEDELIAEAFSEYYSLQKLPMAKLKTMLRTLADGAIHEALTGYDLQFA